MARHVTAGASEAVRAAAYALAFVAMLVAALLASEVEAAVRRAAAFGEVTAVEVVARPGESLWSVARAHPVAGASTAEVVAWICDRNALADVAVAAGEPLVVPAVVAP